MNIHYKMLILFFLATISKLVCFYDLFSYFSVHVNVFVFQTHLKPLTGVC